MRAKQQTTVFITPSILVMLWTLMNTLRLAQATNVQIYLLRGHPQLLILVILWTLMNTLQLAQSTNVQIYLLRFNMVFSITEKYVFGLFSCLTNAAINLIFGMHNHIRCRNIYIYIYIYALSRNLGLIYQN